MSHTTDSQETPPTGTPTTGTTQTGTTQTGTPSMGTRMPPLRSRGTQALLALRRRVLDRRQGDGAMVGLAAAVGIGTGLMAVLLIIVVDAVGELTFGHSPSMWHVLLVPAVGGLVVGLLITAAPDAAGGGGVTKVMRAIALHGGRLNPLTPLAKVLSTGVALGTGAAGGREGPIVHIGGAVGSMFGGWLRLDEERRRTLVAAGAAAGIAASFNAPLGGMLFAMEEIVGGFKVRSLQVVVVASVLASIVSRQFIGEELIYETRQVYVLADPLELVLYSLLGIGAVGIGWLFIDGLARGRRLAARSRLPVWARPAVGGLALGVLALGIPEVLGTGDDLPEVSGPLIGLGSEPILSLIEGAPSAAGWTAVGFLSLLLVAKLLASVVSISSGSPVGNFAPSLFLGASLGGAIGHAAATLLPDAGIRPGAYALVGMAAVFGATAKAPLTGILLVFELTNDYGLVLPLMLATGLATFLADRLWEGSIYTRPLKEEGIVYAEPDDVDVLQTVTVGEIMTTDPLTVKATAPVSSLQSTFVAGGSHGYPVVDDEGRLHGVVTVNDLKTRLDGRDPDVATVADIATHRVVTVTPDDPVFRAVRRMAALNVGRMPVVDPDDQGRLVGLVRRADLVEAYQRAITRSLGVQQRNDRAQLRDLADTQFAEVVIQPGAAAEGAMVKDVDWPERTVLTSIRRAGEIVTPVGDTLLQTGDVVVFLTAKGTVDAVRTILADPVG
ncbi:MAG TPA: chloride channel protein [Euzebya sp.]|nr:chloride channel protein [Euzebya sp.]